MNVMHTPQEQDYDFVNCTEEQHKNCFLLEKIMCRIDKIQVHNKRQEYCYIHRLTIIIFTITNNIQNTCCYNNMQNIHLFSCE